MSFSSPMDLFHYPYPQNFLSLTINSGTSAPTNAISPSIDLPLPPIPRRASLRQWPVLKLKNISWNLTIFDVQAYLSPIPVRTCHVVIHLGRYVLGMKHHILRKRCIFWLIVQLVKLFLIAISSSNVKKMQLHYWIWRSRAFWKVASWPLNGAPRFPHIERI